MLFGIARTAPLAGALLGAFAPVHARPIALLFRKVNNPWSYVAIQSAIEPCSPAT